MIFFVAILFSSAMQAATFSGNGNTGFGGTVGQSTLNLSDDGNSLFVDFSRGPADLNDTLVLYLNTRSGGLAGTSVMTDTSNPTRAAVSGCGSAGGCSSIDFGFDADFAITIESIIESTNETLAVDLYELADGTNYIAVDTLRWPGSPSTDIPQFSLSLADIGLSGSNIEFVGTYLNSANGFLSDEGYGVGLPTGNPGVAASVVFTGSEIYASTVPVPAAVWLFGSALGLLGWIKRKSA